MNDTVLIANPATTQTSATSSADLPMIDYLPTWYAARDRWRNWDPGTGGRAQRPQSHADTPAIAHMDSLGRTFLTIAHNKFEREKSDGSVETVEERYSTRIVLDIEGNQREVIDAKDRVVMRYDYDMLGSQIHSASMDAGERWMLNDVAGKPIHAWDARGHEFRTDTINCVGPCVSS